MPYLYCSECGEIKKQEAIKTAGEYPGEYTKLVSGPLIKEAALCDSCFAYINKGETAFYIIYLSNSVTDPRSETDFFEKKKSKTERY